MSDEFSPPTPAELAPIALHPALVDACQKDPELLVMLARGQLALVQDRLAQRVLNMPDVSVGQLVAVHERLSKVARLEGDKPLTGAGGPSVTINIIRAAGKEQVTIEGQAQRVEPSDAS